MTLSLGCSVVNTAAHNCLRDFISVFKHTHTHTDTHTHTHVRTHDYPFTLPITLPAPTPLPTFTLPITLPAPTPLPTFTLPITHTHTHTHTYRLRLSGQLTQPATPTLVTLEMSSHTAVKYLHTRWLFNVHIILHCLLPPPPAPISLPLRSLITR